MSDLKEQNNKVVGDIDMKQLPEWLQELWNLNPSLARKAEKDYLALKQANGLPDNHEQALPIQCVVGSVYRPKNGHELLAFLKENKKCEVVDGVAFDAAKALEDNKCGFSFSFKKSNWHKGWTSFERC